MTVTPNAEASDGRAATARLVAFREFNGFQPDQAFTSELRTEAVVT